MTFNDFIKKNILKNEAKSNEEVNRVLSSLGLSDVGIYFRDRPFKSNVGIVNLHPSKETHWVCYINENYFDSYRCSPPQKLYKFIIKRNKHCLYSEYKIQGLPNKRDFYCASYCFYIIYLTKMIDFDFKSAVLNFYYQRFSQY